MYALAPETIMRAQNRCWIGLDILKKHWFEGDIGGCVVSHGRSAWSARFSAEFSAASIAYVFLTNTLANSLILALSSMIKCRK
jgi:hypothetical protein